LLFNIPSAARVTIVFYNTEGTELFMS